MNRLLLRREKAAAAGKAPKPPKPERRGLFGRRKKDATAEVAMTAPEPAKLADYASSFELAPALVAMEEHLTGEAIRDVAAELLSRHFGTGRRGLALCSASAGVGVGFVAATIALALADDGISTLLVDANLRHPGLHEHIAPDIPPVGLRQVLMSPTDDPHRVVQREVVPHLSVVYAGGVADDAQGLLGGERFREVMQAYMRDYDVVLVATPPANRSADALRIGAVVGHALIVVGRDRTFLDDVATLAKQLETDGTSVVGLVMNRA